MKAVVLYESMTGNTRRAAELIGGALARAGEEGAVHSITDFDFHELAVADVVVAGARCGVPRGSAAASRVARSGRLRLGPPPPFGLDLSTAVVDRNLDDPSGAKKHGGVWRSSGGLRD